MEHEVFVPVAAGPLRRALADPVSVARAVPGLQQDAGEPPVTGRLKVRVAGSSITYRGTLRVVRRDDGSYTIQGDAVEARGGGTVRVALTLRLTAADGGTTLVFGGGVTGDGRFAELDAGVAATAGRRLLNRFAEGVARVGGESAEPGAPSEPGAPAGGGAASVRDGRDEAADGGAGVADGAGAVADGRGEPARSEDQDASEDGGGQRTGGDDQRLTRDDDRMLARSDDQMPTGYDAAEPPVAEVGGSVFEVDDEPPAEAAHARRTMIGRSAEEVDHAPPRGRYAPVPGPAAGSASAALRWAAPAAALVVASAIVIGRALRRRR